MGICRFCGKKIESGQPVKKISAQEECHLSCFKTEKSSLILRLLELIFQV